jgi:hypothetical protein
MLFIRKLEDIPILHIALNRHRAAAGFATGSMFGAILLFRVWQILSNAS